MPDGMHPVGAAQGRGGHFRQADGADLSFAHQLGECADAVLHGHLGIQPVQVVQIDDLGAQARERFFAGALQGVRPAVDDALAIHPGHAALARQEELRSMGRQHPAEQFLVGAEAVQGGGVEVAHAQFQGPKQERLGGLGRRRYAVGVGEIHASEADGSDLGCADTADHNFNAASVRIGKATRIATRTRSLTTKGNTPR